MNAQPSATCFHCGEPIPPGVSIMARLDPPQPMCCAGCCAVAELIAGSGLADYYRYRKEPGNKSEVIMDDRWQSYAQADIADAFVSHDGELDSVLIMIDDLRCSACVWLIEHHLRQVPGVVRAQVNPVTQRARIQWRHDVLNLAQVLRHLAALGYHPKPLTHQRSGTTIQESQQAERRAAQKRLGVAALGMMQVMMYALPLYVRDQTRMEDSVAAMLAWISLIITTPVLLYSGMPFLVSAWRVLKHRRINMDVPVALALVLAFVASIANLLHNPDGRHGVTYFDSIVMFVFLLSLGRYVEMTVRHRTGSVTDALSRLQPDLAHRVEQQAGHKIVRDVPVSQLQHGDVLLVRSGEVVPADGAVLNTDVQLNEALLTGESLPVSRRVGDTAVAGALNVAAPLRLRVTALGDHTVLFSMVRLLEQAQFDKPKIALFADRIAQQFLWAMLLLTAGTAMAWWFINPARMLDAVLAVLVVTCPCALSLAAPTAISAAIHALAKHGLLVTRADAIERLASIKQVWFDKTGTLTKGQMSITATTLADGFTLQQALTIGVALEAGAQHPIADALRAAWADHSQLPTVHALSVVPGMGVEGVIEGERYRLGRASFVAQLREATPIDHADDHVDGVVLGNTQRECARFTLTDTLRSDAAMAMTALHNQDIHLSLRSGDAPAAVKPVADALDIRDWHARQTPADKLTAIKQANQQLQQVAMVGDGINDAPVLAAAQVGIAMGRGTALAQASADMVLVNERLSALPDAVALARRAQHILHQNLWWAAIYNLTVVPLAACGLITPWLAALGMSLSSVLVTLNAARLMRVSSNNAVKQASVSAAAIIQSQPMRSLSA